MAVAEHEDTGQRSGSGSSARNTALMAAAAAAATSAATIVVRKAMSHDGGGEGRGDDDGGRGGGDSQSLLASAGSSAWEAASDALLPMAEDAADAAGRYLAEHAPDIVRERIVPRFIQAFNDAS